MNRQKLMKVTYYDPKNNIRLTGYSDTVVWDDKGQPTLMALRFGGYPEEVRGLMDAICGGITIEIESEPATLTLKTLPRENICQGLFYPSEYPSTKTGETVIGDAESAVYFDY